jgi:dCTP deaminase
MILTDREIKIALEQRFITIEPMPDLSVAVTSTAIDLTLGSTFKTWQSMSGVSIRPHSDGYSYQNVARLLEDWPKKEFALKPKSFVLAWTAERVTIPYTARLAARVEGKSSLSRLGISVHVTAPTIHAGFDGQIQLEMFNYGNIEVVLDPGMRVCQLIFEQTAGTPERGYSGAFLGQTADDK